MDRKLLALLVAVVGGCEAGGTSPSGDTESVDAARPDDGERFGAGAVDASESGGPLDDAGAVDAAPTGYACHVFELSAAEACGIAMTGTVTPCSIDPDTMTPSQTGSLEVRRPDGSTGYLCSNAWSSEGGSYFGDRAPLLDSPAGCCGGAAGAALDWPAAHPHFGVPHGPTHIKRWEAASNTGGEMRENPFAIVVSNAASAAAFRDARAQWQAWGGDGLPHPGPDGTGAYYFPAWTVINYVVVPTTTGDPILVIAPEVHRSPDLNRPLGHPTLGGCASHGGAPLAYFGGEIHDTVITNHSGRFSAGSSTTPAHLDNAAALFNCYGITVTGVEFQDPDDY